MRCQSEFVGGGQLFHPGFSLTPTKKCFLSRGNFCRVRELPSPAAFGPTSAAVTLRYILPALCDISVAASPTLERSSFQPISPYSSRPSDTAAIATGRPFVLRLCFRICAAIVATSCTEEAIELNLTPVNHLWSFDCHLYLQHWVLLV